MMTHKVLISLGSNLGDRALNIKKAITLIQDQLGDVIAISKLYETASWGYDDNSYLNMQDRLEVKVNMVM